MKSRTEAAPLHSALYRAQTLTEDYERALAHLLRTPPAANLGSYSEEYRQFRSQSLGALLNYVRSYLAAVRNCQTTASGQGLQFGYVAAGGGLLNGRFYDEVVHEHVYLEHEPTVYALIVAYQQLYAHLSQELGQLAV